MGSPHARWFRGRRRDRRRWSLPTSPCDPNPLVETLPTTGSRRPVQHRCPNSSKTGAEGTATERAGFQTLNASLHAFPAPLALPGLSQCSRARSEDVGSASWDLRHALPGLEPPTPVELEALSR